MAADPHSLAGSLLVYISATCRLLLKDSVVVSLCGVSAQVVLEPAAGIEWFEEAAHGQMNII